MKITQLVKELNVLKRKHGDLNVRFDASSLTSDDMEVESCVRPLAVNGVFKVKYEDLSKPRKEILLIDQNGKSEAFEQEERIANV